MSLEEFRKSGVAFKGVTKEVFDRAQKLNEIGKELSENYKQQGAFLGALSGTFGGLNDAAEQYKAAMEGNLDLTEEQVEALREQAERSEEIAGAISDLAPGMVSFAQGAENTARSFATMLGPVGIIIGLLAVAVKLALGFAKAVADTRKDLGVSAATAAKIVAANKALGVSAKAFGLEIEDVKDAQSVILNDLGGSVQEAIGLSLSFARTAAATGQSSENLAKTLSVMESISGASRDVLLNQIRANAAMIEAAGVAPSKVMSDIAENAEFFATFARDGCDNLFAVATQALKLGTSLSTVANTAKGLLDFETSIEKQLEASVLLGRQLNLDRARQLAFTGDIEGLQKEILRQVGSEVEFNKMNFAQREALAGALSMSVEELARTVRSGQARESVQATASMMSEFEKTQKAQQETANGFLNKIEKNTSGVLGELFN